MEGIDTETLVVSANLPEGYSRELKIGDQVEFTPYTNQNEALIGIVVRISENAVEYYGGLYLRQPLK